MERIVVPIRRRKWSLSDNVPLWFGGAIMATVRALLPVIEFFSCGEVREKTRAFRVKLRAILQDSDATIRQIDASHGRDTTTLLDDLIARHGDAEMVAEWNETSRKLHALRQESESVRSIVRGAGEDKTLMAERLREYIVSHPDSDLAYSYLAGVLQQIGDLDGSIIAYKEAIRLAGEHSLQGGMCRLHLGGVLHQKGERDAAIAEYRGVIQDDLQEAETTVSLAYLQLGCILEESGDLHEARIAWKQAIKWDMANIVAQQAREKLRASG